MSAHAVNKGNIVIKIWLLYLVMIKVQVIYPQVQCNSWGFTLGYAIQLLQISMENIHAY